jgi:transcriptional regulator with PAS, ATPase and Fis domain
MSEVFSLAGRVAEGHAKVLITGESGVGKDVVARYIHTRSTRANYPFLAVNCGAIADTLLESELFGHVRGSFTGAHRDKPGKLELASRGTIFLDEVCEMSTRMQVLLLRFLENGEIQQVGAAAPNSRIDVRVVAATNRNIADSVRSGAFREDLLYRLRVVHIHVPPLRERPEDIRPLVELSIARTGRQVRFSEEAQAALRAYTWPGNVRELQNAVEQAVWMSGVDLIQAHHLPAALRAPSSAPRGVSTPERRRQVADDLYAALQARTLSFWGDVYELFQNRDLTRQDIRELVRRGLKTTCGSYRAIVPLFGMTPEDYKRFLNFLAAHDCRVDPQPFRVGPPTQIHPVAHPFAERPEERTRRTRPRSQKASLRPPDTNLRSA